MMFMQTLPGNSHADSLIPILKQSVVILTRNAAIIKVRIRFVDVLPAKSCFSRLQAPGLLLCLHNKAPPWQNPRCDALSDMAESIFMPSYSHAISIMHSGLNENPHPLPSRKTA